MGRKRTNVDPKKPLPQGLYRHGNQFRAVGGNGQYEYFGHDYRIAMERFEQWKTASGRAFLSRGELAELLYRASRKNAIARGIGHDLSVDDINAMLAASRDRCAVTGQRFSPERPPGKRIRPRYPSVDRVDSAKPYTASNCRVVCAAVNVAMNQFGEALLQDFFGRRRRNISTVGNIAEDSSIAGTAKSA